MRRPRITMDEQLLRRVRTLAADGQARSLDFAGVAARVATDGFVAARAPDAATRAAYEDFMLDALARVDAQSAARIAAALAPCPHAPAAVLERLVAFGGPVAARVLREAPRLDDALALARAENGEPCEALAIAARPDLGRPVVAALARRLEPEVLRALVVNGAAALDRGSLLSLTQRGRFDPDLGRALIARSDLPIKPLALFLAADGETRRTMMREAAREARAEPERIIGRLDLARRAAIAAIVDGERRGFCTQVARALRSSRASIERLANDPGGEPLGLLFSAMGLHAAESRTPFLRLRPDLASALDNPSSGCRLALETSVGAAGRIVAAIAHGQAISKPVGEYWNGRRPKAGAPLVDLRGQADRKISRS